MQKINLEKIEEIVTPIAESIGCELVACEWLSDFGRWTLRVFIDKPSGVILSDCEKMSDLLNPVLDVEDLIPGRYHLEVSSPGLERPLKKHADFEKFAGSLVCIKTKMPLDNRSHFKGVLKGIQGDQVQVEVDHHLYSIPTENIRKARLEVDWKTAIKKGEKKKH